MEKTLFDDIIDMVRKEFDRATTKFGKFNSNHEGYAVIKEELEELWEKVKSKYATSPEIIEEAVQVSAMGIRFIYDYMLRC